MIDMNDQYLNIGFTLCWFSKIIFNLVNNLLALEIIVNIINTLR